MPNDDIKQLMEICICKARELLIRDGELIRVFFAMNDSDDMFVIAVPRHEDETDEQASLRNLRIFFALTKTTAYVMVTEAWVATRGPTEKIKLPVSEMEDRREVVMVIGVKRTGQNPPATNILSASCDIIRTETTLDIAPAKWAHEAGMIKMGGRLMNLLPPPDMPEVPDDVRETMLMLLAASGMKFVKTARAQ